MNNTLETAARDYAGIKPDVFIDSEERYYNSHACENYDTFKAGAQWAIDKVCEIMMNFKNNEGEFPFYDYVGNFRKAMEE